MAHSPVPTKFCKYCQHRRSGSDFNWESWRCGNQLLNTFVINPVTGEPKKKAEHCKEVRNDPDLCSIEGQWFEPIGKVAPRLEVPVKKRNLSGLTLDDL